MAKLTNKDKRAIRLEMKRQGKDHDKYWSDRIDGIFRYADLRDVDYFQELEQVYSDQSRQLQLEVFDFYERYAEDSLITLQEAQKRLRGEDLSDYRENAKKYFEQAEDEKDTELLKRLNAQYKSSKVTRLEALELDLTYQLGLLRRTVEVSFADYLRGLGTHAYKKILGGRSASTLNKPALEMLINTPFEGYNYSKQLWGNVDNLAKDLKSTLTKGFTRGLHPRQMAQELRKKYDVSKSRAETLVRTDGTMIINNAITKRYAEAGLTKYKIVVQVDDRTSEICLEVNRLNKVYLLKDAKAGVNLPPLHHNCRSSIIPDEEELGLEEAA